MSDGATHLSNNFLLGEILVALGGGGGSTPAPGASEAKQDAIIIQLSDISETLERANWTKKTGRSKVITYFAGVDATRNPSGSTKNISAIEYRDGATLVFSETMDYDATNNVVKIEFA